MYNFEKNKMILRKEYYEITGKKPEDNIGAYADYLERKLVKNHGVSHHVSDLLQLWAIMSHGEVVSLHISKEGAEVNSERWESKGGTYVVVKVPVFS